jgi:hypothetical protein
MKQALTLFDAIFPLPHDNTRAGVVDGFIGALRREIEAVKKKATSADLWRVDALHFAMTELQMVKDLTKVDVAARLQVLASILTDPNYDEDEKGLAKAGIAIINRVGREIKKLGIA